MQRHHGELLKHAVAGSPKTAKDVAGEMKISRQRLYLLYDKGELKPEVRRAAAAALGKSEAEVFEADLSMTQLPSVTVIPATSGLYNPADRSLGVRNSEAVLQAMNYKGFGVPIFDVDFACGMPDNSSAFMQAYEPIGWLDLPALRGCDALLFARSMSMLGLINPGDMVGVKRIYDYKSMMVYGKPYGIETSDFGIFKYVLRSKKKGNFLLSSENTEEYGDQEIPIRLIKKLWQVRAIVPLSQIKTF